MNAAVDRVNESDSGVWLGSGLAEVAYDADRAADGRESQRLGDNPASGERGRPRKESVRVGIDGGEAVSHLTSEVREVAAEVKRVADAAERANTPGAVV